MSGLTTHVLDTALGKPAKGLTLTLSVLGEAGFEPLCERTTNEDGRVPDLWPVLAARTYCLRFETGPYLLAQHGQTFYPYVEVVFHIERPSEHYHVPLLLSPFGYSTYRGT